MELIPRIIFVVAIALFTLTAAVWDVRQRRLPNWLTVPSFLAGIAFHVVLGLTTEEGMWHWVVKHSLLGAVVGFGPLFLLYLIGGGGAGDAKLITAIGAWLGPFDTFITYVLGTVIGILGSGLLLMFKAGTQGLTQVKRDHLDRRPLDAKTKKQRPGANAGQQRTRTRKQLIPLGLAFAISTWVVLTIGLLTNKFEPSTERETMTTGSGQVFHQHNSPGEHLTRSAVRVPSDAPRRPYFVHTHLSFISAPGKLPGGVS
ncbi:MAG: A24 family peptidase [Pirellulales bacterium]|nr:A24 family peptidase [Pirellulales bacterium]